MDPVYVQIFAIFGVAITVRAVFGFGDALLAMPFLTMLVGLKTAAPMMALVSETIAVTMLWTSWRHVHFAGAWRLIAAGAFGVPAGILLLKGVGERPMTLFLGCIVIGVAVFNLVQPRRIELRTDRWAFLFGFAGGVLGGAYNTNGPPIVIYGTLRHWAPDAFRATLQTFFLASGTMVLIAHGVSGLWTPTVFAGFAAALPAALAALLLGTLLRRRIPAEKFRNYLYVLLILIGTILIVRTLAS